MGEPICRRCGGALSRTGKPRKGGLCSACEKGIRAEATAWQERDYLHAWLYSRAGEDGRTVRRLRARAVALGIAWASEPPTPRTYDARLAALAGGAGGAGAQRRGRPRRRGLARASAAVA